MERIESYEIRPTQRGAPSATDLIAIEAVERIDALSVIGLEINGKPAPEAGLLQR